MSAVSVDAGHLLELISDLEDTARDFRSWLESHPEAWERSRPGKWTVGQHADHVAIAYSLFADRFEAAERDARAGTLARRPWRDPLQALFVRVITRAKRMPRGGKAPAVARPGDRPDRMATLARLAREAARFRALAERMDPGTCARIWARNPFMESWHYTFPEIVRVQALHTRHHAGLAQETESA